MLEDLHRFYRGFLQKDAPMRARSKIGQTDKIALMTCPKKLNVSNAFLDKKGGGGGVIQFLPASKHKQFGGTVLDWAVTFLVSRSCAPQTSEGFIRHRLPDPPSNPPRPLLLRGRFGIDIGSNQEIDLESISNQC